MTEVDSRPAYTVTSQELLASERDFTTFTGHLLRKSEGDTALILGWQADVKAADRAGVLPQRVMDDYQKQKMFKAADVAAKTAKPVPKFAWSPSKLACFELCPAKFAAEFYYKTVPYQETLHTIWGNRVHKAAERHMLGQDVKDWEARAVVLPYLLLLDKLPGKRYVEHRIGVGESWRPMICPNDPAKPWDWGDSVGRMAIDLAIVNGEKARLYDWKTGKLKDDNTQLQINALIFALLHPEVQEIEAKYIWLKDKKTTGFTLKRSELVPIYKDVKTRVARLKEAWDTEVFVTRKNGLCKQYCGAVECAYCGRR